MITIQTTTTFQPSVAEIIDSVPRLSELVQVKNQSEGTTAELLVDERGIVIPLSWETSISPFLRTSPIPLCPELLLGLIFDALGNYEQSQQYLQDYPELIAELMGCYCLQNNFVLSEELAQTLEENHNEENAYRYDHNIALLQQYGLWPFPITLDDVQQRYQRALTAAPDDEYYAFTLKQYATLLIDTQQQAEAEHLLQQHIPRALSEDATYALKSALVSTWMSQLSVPYDSKRLERLKELLWDTLSFHERHHRSTEMGLLLIDASEVANISESYAESLGYINRALEVFQKEDIPELVGSSLLRKGVLLYTWAQNGNPQFYKPAIDTYQEALKHFKRDEAPQTFAEIHSHLGVLYAEMAAMQQKKNIWAAVSATSFQEALRYFTKQDFPYEYGLVCNNYANALTKYPTALKVDNYEKALDYYQEALTVRTTAYPYERALTLLNYLEASWHIDNGEGGFNQARYQDMLNKANEAKTLVDASDLVAEADKHLEQLTQLEQAANSEGYA